MLIWDSNSANQNVNLKPDAASIKPSPHLQASSRKPEVSWNVLFSVLMGGRSQDLESGVMVRLHAVN